MAEHEEDLEVSRRYRELGREDPPRALDDAIRAEARRSAASHPAPLVPPTGRSRWYFPPAAPTPAQVEPQAPRDEVAASRADVEQRREAASAAGAPAARPQAQARMLAKAASPEEELARIAELRKQGRDEEADKALAEFRKRFPDFRISEEMLKRVEKSGSATDFPKRESDTENR